MKPYREPIPTLDLSVVVPVYNERDNVEPLVDDLLRELTVLERSFEVILVNDGSTDGSAEALDAAAARDGRIKVIHFAGNRGQTIAIAAGMYHSSGRVLVLMDGDRQNDPADIGMLIDKLEEGYDCVSGWRKDRKDPGIRSYPSRVANWLVRRATRVPIHDLGCTLKAYTRRALDPTELFGEMHRFLAVYVQGRGGRIAEMVVRHHPRRAGVGKYGLDRTARVLADIILVRILFKYRTRPSHMLAKLTQYVFLAAVSFGLWWLIDAIYYRSITHGAMPFLAALILTVTALVILTTGVVSELVVRNRFVMTGEHPWQIDRVVNFDGSAADSAPPASAVSTHATHSSSG